MSNLGVVSDNNSTVTILGGSSTFTGLGEEVLDFSIVTVMIDSDVDGTLSMQLSTDNVNWDRAKVVPLDVSIGSGSVHTLEVVSRYFRVIYTNGADAQSHFRLQTIYHRTKSGFLTSSPDQVISKINDAQIVRVANDTLLDVSRGLYKDKDGFHRFGHNTVVPNGTFADIWSYGPTDPTYNWPITAETFRVKAGGNAADTSDGAGARTVQVVYLDSTGIQQQDQLTLAGASASDATSVTGTRFIRAWVDTTGTILHNNTAQILFENTTSGLIVGSIETGVGQTEMSQYTIPKDYTGYLQRITVDVAAGTNKDADVIMWQRRGALTFAAPFGTKRIIREWDALQGESTIDYAYLPSFPELTDIWFEGKGNGAATEIDVDYDLILIKDESPTTPQ